MRIQRANLIILTGWQKEHCVTQAASMADTGQADQMREAMADRLIADGMITSPAVEAAFRAGDRVTVVTADGGHGMPERAPYDTIVVTAGAWDMCAARRPDVYPVQPGGIRRYIPGSDGLPESERCREQAHARKPAGTVKASKVGRWETRVIWRKLHCLNPNLQSM